MPTPDPPSLRTTLERSAAVLSKPSARTFATVLDGATFLAASRYVALAAFIAALAVMPAGSSVSLGLFLSTLLGFAAFVWLLHRMVGEGDSIASIGPIAYAVALFWAPLSVVSSAVIAVSLWTGVGVTLAPIVALAVLVIDLFLAYLSLGATAPRASSAARVVVVLAGGLAAYGLERFVWLLVG